MAIDTKALDEVLRQAAIDDPIGVCLALFEVDRMAARMEMECDLREEVRQTFDADHPSTEDTNVE